MKAVTVTSNSRTGESISKMRDARRARFSSSPVLENCSGCGGIGECLVRIV